MNKIIAIFVSISIFMNTTSFAGTSSDIELIRKENEAEKRVESIRTAIRNLPSLINNEQTKIMRGMDRWSEKILPVIIEQHYGDVEAALARTNLPESMGNLSVYWSQLKAGVTFNWLDSDLAEIVKTFENRAKDNLSSSSEKLQEEIGKSFVQEVDELVKNAKEEIRKPFSDKIELLGFLSPPQDQIVNTINSSSSSTSNSYSGAIAITGILLVLSKSIVKKISAGVAAKIFGKSLAKLIPFIGWFLLALEAWDASGARVAIEKELRKGILNEYKAVVTANEIWKGEGKESLRSQFESSLKDTLKNWEDLCKAQAASTLEVEKMTKENPSIQKYVEQELKKGVSIEIVEGRLSELRRVFGTLVYSEPTEKLEDIYITTPDKGDIGALVKAIGAEAINLHEKYGMTLLETVNTVGVENFLKHRASITRIGLDHVRKVSAFYPYVKNDAQSFDGLIASLENGVPIEKITFPKESLILIAKHAQLLPAITEGVGGDSYSLAQIFRSEKSLQNIAEAVKQSPELSKLLIAQTTPSFWNTADVRGIMNVAKLAQDKFGRKADDIIALLTGEDGAELMSIYRESGLNGAGLWLNFVGEGSGEDGKKIAKKAIALLGEGFSASELMTADSVDWAGKCSWLPIGGKTIFNISSSLSRGVHFAILILFAVLVLLISAWGYLRVARMYRRSKIER